jgi:hypothetical protein
MAELKGLALGLQAADQGEREGGLVPPNQAASGNRKANTAKPAGQRVPDLTSTAGKLPGNSSKSAFTSSNPQARRK